MISSISGPSVETLDPDITICVVVDSLTCEASKHECDDRAVSLYSGPRWLLAVCRVCDERHSSEALVIRAIESIAACVIRLIIHRKSTCGSAMFWFQDPTGTNKHCRCFRISTIYAPLPLPARSLLFFDLSLLTRIYSSPLLALRLMSLSPIPLSGCTHSP